MFSFYLDETHMIQMRLYTDTVVHIYELGIENKETVFVNFFRLATLIEIQMFTLISWKNIQDIFAFLVTFSFE